MIKLCMTLSEGQGQLNEHVMHSQIWGSYCAKFDDDDFNNRLQGPHRQIDGHTDTHTDTVSVYVNFFKVRLGKQEHLEQNLQMYLKNWKGLVFGSADFWGVGWSCVWVNIGAYQHGFARAVALGRFEFCCLYQTCCWLYMYSVCGFSMPRPQKASWAGTPDQSTLEVVYFGQRPLSGVSALHTFYCTWSGVRLCFFSSGHACLVQKAYWKPCTFHCDLFMLPFVLKSEKIAEGWADGVRVCGCLYVHLFIDISKVVVWPAHSLEGQSNWHSFYYGIISFTCLLIHSHH